MVDEDLIRAQLDQVLDPCSEVAGVPGGIASMGLIRGLELEERPGGVAVRVLIGITEPGCMMGPAFAAGARERLEALPGVVSVDITLDHRHDWLPSDMSPEYAARLEAARAARRSSAVALLPNGGVVRKS